MISSLKNILSKVKLKEESPEKIIAWIVKVEDIPESVIKRQGRARWNFSESKVEYKCGEHALLFRKRFGWKLWTCGHNSSKSSDPIGLILKSFDGIATELRFRKILEKGPFWTNADNFKFKLEAAYTDKGNFISRSIHRDLSDKELLKIRKVEKL